MKRTLAWILVATSPLASAGVALASEDDERHERHEYEEQYRPAPAEQRERERHEYGHEQGEYPAQDKRPVSPQSNAEQPRRQ